MNEFYVYKHVRLDTHTTFYVGKGKGNRISSTQRNKYWHNIVKKHGYISKIIKCNLLDSQACELETLLIKLYKKYGRCEANILSGGQSNSGTNNPMYGKGYKLSGSKNGMYRKTGKMKGRKGNKHPKFNIKESRETRNLKRQAHLKNRKWIYITPAGIFKSLTIAAHGNFVTVSSVKARCRSSNYQNWYRLKKKVET